MDNKVYIIECPNYEQADEKLNQLLDGMGGMGTFIATGEKVALKVNLLRPAAPEEAVTTHPAIVAAVAKLAKACQAVPLIVDSPGAGYAYNETTLDMFYRLCGMFKAANEAGIDVNWDLSSEKITYPQGRQVTEFEIISPILKSDGVINLCKLKTHLFTMLTGAVKNNFGAIPGLAKPGYHAKLQEMNLFTNMLLDVAGFVAPRLSIMDAVVAMEGLGPGTGDPRQVGWIIASTNPLALDVIAGEIIGLERENNPFLTQAEKRGLGPNRLADVELVGADKKDLRIPGFKLPPAIVMEQGPEGCPGRQTIIEPETTPGLALRPRVVLEKCQACGACRDTCPMSAIVIVDEKYADIDQKTCIRCYCCHEMCQYQAIELKQGIF